MRIGERNYRQEKKNYLSMLSDSYVTIDIHIDTAIHYWSLFLKHLH